MKSTLPCLLLVIICLSPATFLGQELIRKKIFDDPSIPSDISFNAITPTTDGGYAMVGKTGNPSQGVVLKVSNLDELQWWYQYGNGDNLDNMEFNDIIQIGDYLFIVGDGYDDNGNRQPYIQKTELEQNPDSASFVGSFSFENDVRMFGARGLAIQRTYVEDRFVIGGYGFPEGNNGPQQGYFYQMLIEPDHEINVAGADPTFKAQTQSIWEIERSPAWQFFYLFATSARPAEEACDSGGQDVLVARLNDVLEFSWTPEFNEVGGNSRDGFVDAITTADGGFAILGQTNCQSSSGNSGPNNVCLDSSSFQPFWLYKGDRDGSFEWTKSLLGAIATVEPFGLFNYCLQDEYMLGYNDLSAETGNGLELYRMGESLDQIRITREDFSNVNDQAYQIIRSATGELVVGSTSCVFNDGCEQDLTAYRFTREQDCYSICDLSATFIGGNTDYILNIDAGDAAPPLISTIPCVLDAYDENIPSRLLYSLRLYENSSFQPIDFQPEGDVGPNFRAFIFRCEQIEGSVSQTCEGRYEDLKDTALPAGFYYILITDTEERDVEVFIPVPGSVCDLDMAPTLSCGNPTIQGPVQRPSEQLNRMNVGGFLFDGYDMCYAGIRTYAGVEEAFLLEITEPSRVDLTFSTVSGKGGLFIFNGSQCGEKCVNYLEAPDGGGEVTLSGLTLTPERYFLVVDQEADAPIMNFLISIDCREDIDNNDLGRTLGLATPQVEECELLSESIDEIRLKFQSGGDNQNYSNEDIFSFNIPERSFKNNDDLAKFYSGGNTLVFQIRESIENPPCSFQPGDSLQLFLTQRDGFTPNYFPLKAEFYDTDNPNVRTSGKFQGGASKTILSFSKLDPLPALTAFTSFAFGPNENSRRISIQPATNISFERTENWVSVLVNGTNYEVVVQRNESYTPRNAKIIVEHGRYPDLRKTIQVTQYGKCETPIVQDDPVRLQVCQGQAIELQSDVMGPGPDSIYAYRWSNGQEGPAITVMPTTDATYEVTVTQNPSSSCTALNTQTFIVDVIDAPPSPTTSELISSFCDGNEPNELTAFIENNDQLSIQWYDSLGGLPIGDGSTYQPDGEGIYLARAVDPISNCQSPPLTFEVVKETPFVLLTSPEQEMLSGCLGDAVTFSANSLTGEQLELTWSIDGEPMSNDAIWSYDLQNSGQTNIGLTANRPNGSCKEVRSFTVEAMEKPQITAASPSEVGICQGENTVLEIEDISGTFQVNWYNSNNIRVATDRLTHEVSMGGTYYAVAEYLETGFEACSSDSLVFNVTESPSLNLETLPVNSMSIEECLGESITLQAIVDVEGANFEWRTNGNTIGNQPTLEYSPQIEGVSEIDLIVTSIDGICEEQQTFEIEVFPSPTILRDGMPECAEDSDSYSLSVITTDTDSIFPDNNQVEIVPLSAEGSYRVSNIPSDELVNITVSRSAEELTCTAVLSLSAEGNCSCGTTEVPVPEATDRSVTYCVGDPRPPLSVSVNLDLYTVNWYDELGVLVESGDTSFTPNTDGQFYAEAQLVGSVCRSMRVEFEVALATPLSLQPKFGEYVIADPSYIPLCQGSMGPLLIQPIGAGFTFEWVKDDSTISDLPFIPNYIVDHLDTSIVQLSIYDQNDRCVNRVDFVIDGVEKPTISNDGQFLCSDDEQTFSATLETTFTDTLIFDPPGATYENLGQGIFRIDNLRTDTTNTISAWRAFADNLLCRADQLFLPFPPMVCGTPVSSNVLKDSRDIVKVYPNPTSTSLTVEFDKSPTGQLEFQLLDVLGRRQWSSVVRFPVGGNQTSLDLTSVASGTYWLQIRTRTEQFIFRVVKTH